MAAVCVLLHTIIVLQSFTKSRFRADLLEIFTFVLQIRKITFNFIIYTVLYFILKDKLTLRDHFTIPDKTKICSSK